MNPETLEALKGSIKKWKRIVASTKALDQAVNNCPLCGLFFCDNDCEGCPVREKTEQNSCEGSPYIKWHLHNLESHSYIGSMHRIPRCRECLRLAREERDFLISLLPEHS